MIKGLDETIYGLAYRNGRYAEGEWMVHFFETETQRDAVMRQFTEAGDIVPFQFLLRQILPKGKE